MTRDEIASGPASMWRYAALLPTVHHVSLPEGWTPLLHCGPFWLKDEGRNPSGSFTDRTFSYLVSTVKLRGESTIRLTVRADSAVSFAKYAAAAGLKAAVEVSSQLSSADFTECSAYGADIQFRFGAKTTELPLEGTQTLAFEIAEQLNWVAPEVVVHPPELTDALQKGFEELTRIGWILQSPLLVVADAIKREVAMDAALKFAATTGIFVSHAGGACIARAEQLECAGDRIVVVNPASGARNAQLYATRYHQSLATEQDKLGGLITPR